MAESSKYVTAAKAIEANKTQSVALTTGSDNNGISTEASSKLLKKRGINQMSGTVKQERQIIQIGQ